MNTKLFWITVFALLALCVQNASVKKVNSEASADSEDPVPELYDAFEKVNGDEPEEEEEEGTADQNTADNQTDNQGSQDGKDSADSSQEVPMNERIYEADTMTDAEYRFFTVKSCEFVQVVLNKRDTEIKANAIFNTDEILVTSVQIEECDEISEYYCPPTGFCQRQRLLSDDEEGIKLNDEPCETEVLYLYPIPVDPAEKVMSFEVKVVIGEELECPAKSSSNTPNTDNSGNAVSETTYEKSGDELAKAEEICGAYANVDTCQSTENACSSQCMWVTCGVKTEEGQRTNTSSSCVPLVASYARLEEGCQAKDEFATASKDNQVIDYPVCSAAEHGTSSLSPIINHPASKLIGMTLLTLSVLFLVVVCFYRCQFRKYGEGPFNPPSYCPGFIFPRQKLSAFAPIPVSRHELVEVDYQPPVPVL